MTIFLTVQRHANFDSIDLVNFRKVLTGLVNFIKTVSKHEDICAKFGFLARSILDFNYQSERMQLINTIHSPRFFCKNGERIFLPKYKVLGLHSRKIVRNQMV